MAVDDYGRLDARPRKLKAVLFPVRVEATPDLISGWVRELTTIDDPPIRLYTVGDRPCLYLPNWERHRGNSKRSQKSRYPKPPEVIENARVSPISPGDPGDARGSGDPPDPRPLGVGRYTLGVGRLPLDVGLTTTSRLGIADGHEGKSPEPKSMSPAAKAKALALEVWPELVAKAASHGRSWRGREPGQARLAYLVARINQGATRVELLAAIDGFAALHGDRLDTGDTPMRKYLRVETIYQASKFDGYLEAANDASASDTRKAAVEKQTQDMIERMREFQDD